MSNDIIDYYQKELSYLRTLGAEFADTYPDVARRLKLEPDRCTDPHVERLLEGFAFLTARIRKKLDDEYPEITNALLGVLYPHYQRPLPSMSVVQCTPPVDLSRLTNGFTINRGAELVSLRAVDGQRCQFRTTADATLWPVKITNARLFPDRVDVPNPPRGAAAMFQISLERSGVGSGVFPWRNISFLRMFIDGEAVVAHAIHEALLNDLLEIRIQGVTSGKTVRLGPDSLAPVGFEPEQGAFPHPGRSFVGYRLIQEYWCFPEKFWFFDVLGWIRSDKLKHDDQIELQFLLNRRPRIDVESSVNRDTFKLGCTPIVNLFVMNAEPIMVKHHQSSYPIVPDVNRRDGTEIYSVDEVSSRQSYLAESKKFEPFYTLRHALRGPAPEAFWYAVRVPAVKPDDPGTEVELSFVDTAFNPRSPGAEVLLVRATCTNRNLPSRMSIGGKQAKDQGDFELKAQAPVGITRCLRTPTRPLRPPMGRDAQWRLISHLSLNHLSLEDDDAGRGLESLRAILKIYDFANSDVTRQQLAGIDNLATSRTTARIVSQRGAAVCQGVDVQITFDESKFVGSGAFLLACVLERFLGMYVSINSFTQLTALSKQREGVWRRWRPRTGDRTLI